MLKTFTSSDLLSFVRRNYTAFDALTNLECLVNFYQNPYYTFSNVLRACVKIWLGSLIILKIETENR